MSQPPESSSSKSVALVTGVGRRAGIGFAVADRLARDGFDVAINHWTAYDNRVHRDSDGEPETGLAAELEHQGCRTIAIDADLERPETVSALFDRVEASLGSVAALIMCHCESVDSGILDTTEESFDRHISVNARSTWLLIREFGRRYKSGFGAGRIVAFTSDHTVGNLPYGASKGALDRITIAAAHEFANLGVSVNVINPGPTDTGWMSAELKSRIIGETPLARLGTPEDAANLVSFLCSPRGGWINGQLIHSNGGFGTS
ncbi:MAG: SDR family oxidoreductase [Acidimicrobiales bacterium]